MGLDKRTGVVFQLGFRIIDVGPKGPSTRREIVSPFILPMEKKLLSVFVDESGDDGFGKKGSSEFYIFTMVFHDQRLSVKSNIEKIVHLPVFHAGPILRGEEPFDNADPKERKKLFQSIFVFASALPVKWVTFKYRKGEFKDYLSLQRRIFRDLRRFLYNHESFFSGFDDTIIYYGKGQHNLSSVLNLAFADAPFPNLFHDDVKPELYRLFQVADFVSTIRLLEEKKMTKTITEFEARFIDEWHFKNVYLKMLNRKEMK